MHVAPSTTWSNTRGLKISQNRQCGHNGWVPWETVRVPDAYDVLAPDGSEIRLLPRVAGGSMVHCVLRSAQVTQAVRHRTVEELWFCVGGAGQVWRRDSLGEEIVELRAGVGLSIPCGVAFQFRATSAQPLEVVIATMPPWPGADEAEAVAGAWQPTLGPAS
jgi:mannose-6-phosphate isomerase-like protein (cupin superfamily)